MTSRSFPAAPRNGGVPFHLFVKRRVNAHGLPVGLDIVKLRSTLAWQRACAQTRIET